MTDAIKSAVWEMVEAGGRTAKTFGISRTLGQVYALLYVRNEPLSLDQIVEELEMSKASVSIACRQLYAFGAVRHTSLKGDRRDFYEAEEDFRGLLLNGILPMLEKKLNSAGIQIERCRKMLELSDTEEVQRIRKRLDDTEKRRAKMISLLRNPLIKRML